MIQANELRIGNWVRYKLTAVLLQQGWYIGEVQSISEKTVQIKDQILTTNFSLTDSILPIELSPEILTEWCGFRVVENGFEIEMARQSFRISKDGLEGDDEWYLFFQEDIGCGFNFLTFCNYLHEIQNIIYWATNDPRKELEIKIPVKS